MRLPPMPSPPCAGSVGSPPGATACARRSCPGRSSWCSVCTVTRPAVIGPRCRACGAGRRLTVRRAPHARGASWPWCARASAARCRALGLAGGLRAADGAAAGVRLPRGVTAGAVPCRPRGLLTLVVAPLRTHALARGQAVPPSVPPGDVLVAARGRWADAPLARLVQAGVQAGRRLGARPLGEVTPGRPVVRPRGRRTPAVPGLPRPRWRTRRGVHDPLGAWWAPQPGPSWLAQATLAALPET